MIALSLVATLACLLVAAALLVLVAWWRFAWMPGPHVRSLELTLDPDGRQRAAQLRADLNVLASEIGPRNVSDNYRQLQQAAEFIEQTLRSFGYSVRRQPFDVEGQSVWNLDVERTGAARAEEIIVVGAHYDTVPGSPGANDNGSAVVANLALARAFVDQPVDRTIRFAFFVNEEMPYYMTPAMGSLRYAQACHASRENIVGMIGLETIGCYVNEPGTQRYPVKILNWLYPTTGNFLAIVGNVQSRRWVHQVVRGFRRTRFPSEGIAAPSWLRDIFRSDHAAFWQTGYSALMVTDTANFRYPHYHQASDTPDKINYEALSLVVGGLEDCLRELARDQAGSAP